MIFCFSCSLTSLKLRLQVEWNKARCLWPDHHRLLARTHALLTRFFDFDRTCGGRCSAVWTALLRGSFNDMFGDNMPLIDMVMALVSMTFKNREDFDGHQPNDVNHKLYDYVEYCAGTANLSKELIRSGFWGASLDKLYLEDDHDMLSLKGIKLFITMLLASRFGALHWFGTCCSSFVVLCQSVSLRSALNSFVGDETRNFVAAGNSMSEVSALLFFLSLIVQCCPVLEQPMSSTMPLTPSWHAILMFFQCVRTPTYMGQYGGFTQKPLQLWHKPGTFEGLARSRPSFALQTLASRDHEGNFTGKKDLLVISGAYTVQFGSAVASIFSTLR